MSRGVFEQMSPPAGAFGPSKKAITYALFVRWAGREGRRGDNRGPPVSSRQIPRRPEGLWPSYKPDPTEGGGADTRTVLEDRETRKEAGDCKTITQETSTRGLAVEGPERPIPSLNGAA